MRKTIHAASARGMLIALSAALLLSAGPAVAEAKGEADRTRAEAQPISEGAGYEDPDGSQRVRALQRRLRRAGASPGPVDGLFGPLTEAAVRRFQGREGLAVDGLVGPLTTAALKREAALIASGAGYGDPDGSERVRALQKRLRQAGVDPGPIDGRFGPRTEAAVRRFQGRQGLEVDGLVDEATRVALARRAASAVPERRASAPQPDPPTPRPQPARQAEQGPSEKPEPPVGAQPGQAADADPARPGLPAWDIVLVLAAGLALLAGAVALALGRPRRRRRGGEPSASEPLPRAPRPAAPGTGAPQPSRSRLAAAPRHAAVSRQTARAPAPVRKRPMLGYAVVSAPADGLDGRELTAQAESITADCERRGVELLELVREREPRNGKGLNRPGLGYACTRIAAGEAQGLIVSELSRLSRSAAELGQILQWFMRSGARLVAVAQGLDTNEPEGRLAASTIIHVSGWERERLSERTQKGLQAARLEGRRPGRPAVADDRELSERITRMRADGMTMQAIADRLNQEGVPTVRGGAKWRPSSVQGAVGYKRPRPKLGSLPGRDEAAREER
jgi:peptidoglycan hydrolase-like protein with peptidoglycan-binding domain/DNA invertase Pin-like site-specific DNA recombinase